MHIKHGKAPSIVDLVQAHPGTAATEDKAGAAQRALEAHLDGLRGLDVLQALRPKDKAQIDILLAVTSLDLSHRNLRGALAEGRFSDVLSAMPQLTSLNLAGNNLRVSLTRMFVPDDDEIGRALRNTPKLKHLDLRGNMVSEKEIRQFVSKDCVLLTGEL